MALEHHQTMDVEEYFALEEQHPEVRYEYVDGYVYMMAGGTINHDTIKANVERILWHLLRGSKCRTFSSDMRVSISPTRYYHPDVTVGCNPLDRGTQKQVQYPRLVVEVLSPGTERKDRREKLRDYLASPTIEEYVLIDSRTVRMEIYRKEGRNWLYESLQAGDEVTLTCLAVHFPLAAAYEDVLFENNDTSDEDEDDDWSDE